MLRGGLRPWSRKGPDHGVGVDPETVTFKMPEKSKEFQNSKGKPGVALANQTKERSVHELFAGAFRSKSSM